MKVKEFTFLWKQQQLLTAYQTLRRGRIQLVVAIRILHLTATEIFKDFACYYHHLRIWDRVPGKTQVCFGKLTVSQDVTVSQHLFPGSTMEKKVLSEMECI